MNVHVEVLGFASGLRVRSMSGTRRAVVETALWEIEKMMYGSNVFD